MRSLLALSLLLTGGLYLVMVGWTLPMIAGEAGGLVPFDMRPTGYSAEEARAFLAALSPKGTDVYLRVQQWLDTVFPGALAVSSVWLVALAWRGAIRIGVSALALVAAAADYAENHVVAQMLHAGTAGFDPALAAAASRWTELKSGASTVVYVFLLVGLGRWLWARRRG